MGLESKMVYKSALLEYIQNLGIMNVKSNYEYDKLCIEVGDEILHGDRWS